MNVEQEAISDTFMKGLEKYQSLISRKVDIQGAHTVITEYLNSPIEFTAERDSIKDFEEVIECLEQLEADKILIIVLKTIHTSASQCRDSMRRMQTACPLDDVITAVERCLYYGRCNVAAFHALIVESV